MTKACIHEASCERTKAMNPHLVHDASRSAAGGAAAWVGRRVEEANEKRHGMLARLKVSEKEKEGLQGKAEEAQQFLDKQAEMLRCRINSTHAFTMKVQVRRGWGWGWSRWGLRVPQKDAWLIPRTQQQA